MKIIPKLNNECQVVFDIIKEDYLKYSFYVIGVGKTYMIGIIESLIKKNLVSEIDELSYPDFRYFKPNII